MRYSFVSAAVLAFSSSVFATEATLYFDSITVPTNLQPVAAGDVLPITWDPTSAVSANTKTVDIYLLEGATQATLQVADQTIASAVTNSVGTYSWTVPSTVAGFALYGFKIVDSSNTSLFQYSYPFTIADSSSNETSATGSAIATTTVQLSANSAYAVSSAAFTSSAAPNNTISAIVSATASAVTGASNLTATISTIKTTSAIATKTSSKATASAASSGLPTASSNPAAANIANGGLALIGAALIALVL